MLSLSNRSLSVQPSVTLAVNARATELRQQGKAIINLSVGEPDFDTPDFIKQAAIQAVEAGFTKYTAADGIPELKRAILHKLKRDNNLDYTPEQVIVSNGAKQGLYNLCQTVLNPGDEVVIPAPYWVSYPAMVALAEAKPVIVQAGQDQDFKITPDQLRQALTPNTKLVFLNSPCNPTGKVYTAAELEALTDVIKQHNSVLLATDDIYEYILWQADSFVTPLNVCPELKERTVVFNGVSKAYAMTGWRIGYAVGPESIIKGMKKIQSQSTGNPNSIAQKAAVAALMADRAKLQPMFEAFKRRHDQLLADLNAIKGFTATPADGTFYLFVNVEQAIKKLGLKNDVELATYLLDHALVATVPGSGFGMPGYLRFSYAVSSSALKQAAERIYKLFR